MASYDRVHSYSGAPAGPKSVGEAAEQSGTIIRGGSGEGRGRGRLECPVTAKYAQGLANGAGSRVAPGYDAGSVLYRGPKWHRVRWELPEAGRDD